MPHTTSLASAVLTASLTTPGTAEAAPGRIQLFPLGEFRARDGRPGTLKGCKCAAWRLTREDAAALVGKWRERATPVVVDYEHQTHHADQNGQPAPAAGWITALHLEDDGLYATVEWTDRAREYIRAREYRYISPTFSFEGGTGVVLDLKSVALTNYPALDGMEPARAKTDDSQGAEDMEKLMAILRVLLGLPETADEAQCTAVLAALPYTALPVLLAAKDKEIAALRDAAAADPDPAKYAPVALLTATQAQLAATQAQLKELQDSAATSELAGEIDAALKDGRLHAAGKDWALALAKSDPAALRTYLETAPPIAALKGGQTGGKEPGDTGGGGHSLSDEERYACAQLGMSEAEYCKTKKECN